MAKALGPHELLVLANESSPRSVAVAEEFMRLRHVPALNLVRLRLPPAATNAPASVSAEDFGVRIWAPAVRALRERGLREQILAWVYSVDFPVLIQTSPPLSIQGITFLRNRLPDLKEADAGTYASPLFAGARNPREAPYLSQSLDTLREWLGPEMPLPSMMLGYAGERGNSLPEITACLERGWRSDGTGPKGTVYFVTGSDIRSTSRDWQYAGAVRELAALGVKAVTTEYFPAARKDVLGVMMGARQVRPDEVLAYLPGAMAEHFTSAAAIFHSADQTKLSAWIAAGATASAGTVTEPYAIWTKFPHARFFVHYAAGCTMLESFFQAIRCPLQILLVGDPLAQPWAPADGLALAGVPAGGTAGRFTVEARVDPAARRHYGRFLFLLDGRPVGREPRLELDAARLTEGAHTVRAVASRSGLVRTQVFAEQSFRIGHQPVSGAQGGKPGKAADG